MSVAEIESEPPKPPLVSFPEAVWLPCTLSCDEDGPWKAGFMRPVEVMRLVLRNIQLPDGTKATAYVYFGDSSRDWHSDLVTFLMRLGVRPEEYDQYIEYAGPKRPKWDVLDGLRLLVQFGSANTSSGQQIIADAKFEQAKVMPPMPPTRR